MMASFESSSKNEKASSINFLAVLGRPLPSMKKAILAISSTTGLRIVIFLLPIYLLTYKQVSFPVEVKVFFAGVAFRAALVKRSS
ncbi:MAG TPA: hypothetical protein VFE57_12450 [Cyclobacteriaceae bacterium]|nr:hypothetical protein [Cyclobacteriaceae bacterium]